MKARIRGTNIEIDVQPAYDEVGYFAGFKDNDYKYYQVADLVFADTPEWDNTDWSSFRREAAKDILVGLSANNNMVLMKKSIDDLAKLAVVFADKLIEQLQNK